MKKLNRKNKSRLCYLLTIPFLTLTNIPNIIFSYDNDVWATNSNKSFNRQREELWKARELTSNLFNAIKDSNSDSNKIKQTFIKLLYQLSILDENNFNEYSNPMTIANLFNNLSKKMKKNEIEGILKEQSIRYFKNANDFLYVFIEQTRNTISFFKPIGLANTFNGLAQIGFDRNDFVNALESEDNMINFLGSVLARTRNTINTIGSFAPVELANTFNGLAKIGFRRTDFVNALKKKNIVMEHFLGSVLKQTQSEIGSFAPVELANTFNGLAKIGFRRNDFVNVLENEDNMINFLGSVLKQTQSEIGSFEPIGLANTFNGFAQIGFRRNDFFNALEKEGITIEAFLGSVLKQTRNTIGSFEPIGLANIFNGFVTIFLYDNEESNYYSKYFKDIITNIISNIKEKENDFDYLGKYNINKNIFFLKNVLGIDLDTNGISFLSEDLKCLDNNVKTKQMSNLEQTALEQIRKSGIVKTNTKVKTEEKIFYKENGIRIHHSFDFYFKTEDNKDVYLEVDGPHHFIDSKQTIKTPSTIIRDKINKKILPNKAYYLSISEKIINEGGLISYIKDKLKGKLNIKENSEEEEQVGTTTGRIKI